MAKPWALTEIELPAILSLAVQSWELLTAAICELSFLAQIVLITAELNLTLSRLFTFLFHLLRDMFQMRMY